MNRKIVIPILLISVLLAAPLKPDAQSNKTVTTIESTLFLINSTDGWQLLNSYIKPFEVDSVQMELILQCANTIDWSKEQYLGKIKAENLAPSKQQTVPFKLITDQYLLRIDMQGKCYLRLFSGNALADNPAVIPIKVFYKK